MASAKDTRAHLLELIQDFDTATLVTRSAEGTLHGRPMQLAELDEHEQIWFVTRVQSTKVDDIAREPRGLITMQGPRKYVTVRGRLEIHRDAERVRKLWKESWRIWFQDTGDPDLVLLKFVPSDGEYWDNTGVRGVRYALNAAKALISRNKSAARSPDSQLHAHVSL